MKTLRSATFSFMGIVCVAPRGPISARFAMSRARGDTVGRMTSRTSSPAPAVICSRSIAKSDAEEFDAKEGCDRDDDDDSKDDRDPVLVRESELRKNPSCCREYVRVASLSIDGGVGQVPFTSAALGGVYNDNSVVSVAARRMLFSTAILRSGCAAGARLAPTDNGLTRRGAVSLGGEVLEPEETALRDDRRTRDAGARIAEPLTNWICRLMRTRAARLARRWLSDNAGVHGPSLWLGRRMGFGVAGASSTAERGSASMRRVAVVTLDGGIANESVDETPRLPVADARGKRDIGEDRCCGEPGKRAGVRGVK